MDKKRSRNVTFKRLTAGFVAAASIFASAMPARGAGFNGEAEVRTSGGDVTNKGNSETYIYGGGNYTPYPGGRSGGTKVTLSWNQFRKFMKKGNIPTPEISKLQDFKDPREINNQQSVGNHLFIMEETDGTVSYLRTRYNINVRDMEPWINVVSKIEGKEYRASFINDGLTYRLKGTQNQDYGDVWVNGQRTPMREDAPEVLWLQKRAETLAQSWDKAIPSPMNKIEFVRPESEPGTLYGNMYLAQDRTGSEEERRRNSDFVSYRIKDGKMDILVQIAGAPHPVVQLRDVPLKSLEGEYSDTKFNEMRNRLGNADEWNYFFGSSADNLTPQYESPETRARQFWKRRPPQPSSMAVEAFKQNEGLPIQKAALEIAYIDAQNIACKAAPLLRTTVRQDGQKMDIEVNGKKFTAPAPGAYRQPPPPPKLSR